MRNEEVAPTLLIWVVSLLHTDKKEMQVVAGPQNQPK